MRHSQKRWWLGLTLAALAAGSAHPASALTAADQDAAINSYNNAFYTITGSTGNYVLDNVNRGYPQTYSFWRMAEEMEMLEDAYDQTHSATYKTMIDQLYNGFVQVNGTGWTANGFNDDLMWISIACLRAYQITGTANYYNMAKSTFDTVYARAYDTNLGGGLWWTTDKTSKNACVNGPAAIAAALLYQCGAGSGYLTKAQSIFSWEASTLYHSNGQVQDSISSSGMLNGGALTYNQGTFIGAADLLNQITGTGSYDQYAVTATSYTMNSCTGENAPGILWNEYSAGSGDSDGAGFKGIFARWCCRWVKRTGHTEYMPWLQRNAQMVWDKRNTAGLSWGIWGLSTPSSLLTSWECSSAVSMIQNVTAFTPVTATVPNATYTLSPRNAVAFCLDASGSGTANGTKADIWTANNQSNQKWIVTNMGSNLYKIQPSYATGLALDVNGGGSGAGSSVDLWQDNGGTAQRWTPIANSNGTYKLVPQCAPAMVLELSGGAAASGSLTDVWYDTGMPHQQWIFNILPGTYTLTPGNATGSRLDAAAAGTTNGTVVDIWPANNQSNQNWAFTSLGSGQFKIQPSYALGLALDVYGANSTAGSNVDLWQDNGSSSQRWTPILNSNGTFKLTPQCAPGMVMDVYNGNTAAGTHVEIWNDNNASNQQWGIH